jgi:hypothetical protein
MRPLEPVKDRHYNVFYRWRGRPDDQQYSLGVAATTVERAISKVKKEQLEEYSGTRADILIDHVELIDRATLRRILPRGVAV